MAGGVLRVRSSSSMWSSLRSISSRRWRIRERLLSEVMTSRHGRKRPQPGGWGACQAGASVGRADRTRPLHSAAVGEVCWFFASPTSPSVRYRLVALPTSGHLFIRAKHLFVDATTARLLPYSIAQRFEPSETSPTLARVQTARLRNRRRFGSLL